MVFAMGGPEAYRGYCLEFGYEVPTAAAIYQWIKRKSAPASAIATMLMVHNEMQCAGKIPDGKRWKDFIRVTP